MPALRLINPPSLKFASSELCNWVQDVKNFRPMTAPTSPEVRAVDERKLEEVGRVKVTVLPDEPPSSSSVLCRWASSAGNRLQPLTSAGQTRPRRRSSAAARLLHGRVIFGHGKKTNCPDGLEAVQVPF